MSLPRDRLRISAIFVVSLLASTLCGCGEAHGKRLESTCQRFATTHGSARANGTSKAPFKSVQRLVEALRPGQTGCLEGGTYSADVRFPRGGTRRRPITLRSAPGTRATIVGRMYLPVGANDVHVDNLVLNGFNAARLPSPTVYAADDQFVNDEVFNGHTAICFVLGGDGGYQRARRTLIERDRIHDCGTLPPANHEHGIYVANSVGARIIDNVIYDNADRGIQLYWNAQRTTIAGNIINHNGEGILISGDFGDASSHNLIIDNAITNSTVRADVESYWPDEGFKGAGNLVIGNCVHGGKRTIDQRDGGFVTRGNSDVNPRYADPAVGNYSLLSGSPCAPVLAHAVARANSFLRANP
jgi:hypothetical protein